MLKFKEYLRQVEMNVPGKHLDYAQGAIGPSHNTGSETGASDTYGNRTLSSQDLIVKGVPHETIVGRVSMIDPNKTPIYIQVADDRGVVLAHVEIPERDLNMRLTGVPAKLEDMKGKRIRIVLQRRKEDTSRTYTKIAWGQIY